MSFPAGTDALSRRLLGTAAPLSPALRTGERFFSCWPLLEGKWGSFGDPDGAGSPHRVSGRVPGAGRAGGSAANAGRVGCG